MKSFSMAIAIGIIGLGLATGAQADTIATWTFETNTPADLTDSAVYSTPVAADVGTGNATGVHASAATDWTTPAGNGTANSFSSNTWAVGDYYQFSVSTIGFNGITLSWDQTGSSTGPKDYKLAYSTNGATFTDFATYTVLSNTWSSGTNIPASNISQNLSSVTALYNQASVYFRLIDNSTTALNGGTVAAAGTDRVDNFSVSGTVAPVPVPAAIWLLGSGLIGLVGIARRRTV